MTYVFLSICYLTLSMTSKTSLSAIKALLHWENLGIILNVTDIMCVLVLTDVCMSWHMSASYCLCGCFVINMSTSGAYLALHVLPVISG